MNTTFDEVTLSIGEIEALLAAGHSIEVDSPDGWVPVSNFVDKGEWDEYVLNSPDSPTIRCNENHLFETSAGWQFAKDMVGKGLIEVLHKDGTFHKAECIKTGNRIPIVDITVDHENHRYYTEEFSSHNTGTGKSLVMCDFAASYLSRGLNVLYVTLEMAEERIAERIDANLLDIQIDKLGELAKDVFVDKVRKIGEKSHGRLVVKEYPTSSMHVGHLRALLNELQIKKNFKPDIVFVDYLNIMASSRIKSSGAAETYTYCKAIAEELRGLATERDIPIWTATQANRAGNDNSDLELGNTSESFGVPMSLDLFLAIISTEELQELGQLMFKQLKNRYNDVNFNKRFVVGINRSKMKLFDVDASAQTLISSAKSTSAPVAQSPFAAGKGGRSAAIAKLTGLKV